MTPRQIGAALTAQDLDTHLPWIMDGQRDLEIQDFVFPPLLEDGAEAHARQILARLDGHMGRRGIHGPFWDLPLDATDPRIRAVAQERFSQALDLCAMVGGTHMVLHSPFRAWDYNNLPSDRDAHTRKCALVQETLTPVVAKAKSMGITLVIENIEDIDPMDRVRLAQQLGSDVVRVSLDTGHAQYAFGTHGGRPVDYHIKAAGKLLAHVHLQDADGYADRHWAIGEGAILWPSVFRALNEHAPDARLVLELRDKVDIPASFAWLRNRGLAI